MKKILLFTGVLIIMDIWNLFCETGSIDAYILYSLTENDFAEQTADRYDNE